MAFVIISWYNNPHKSYWEGGTVQLTVVHFNVQKRWFSQVCQISSVTGYSILGYNRTVTLTNTQVLFNTGPRLGKRKKFKIIVRCVGNRLLLFP